MSTTGGDSRVHRDGLKRTHASSGVFAGIWTFQRGGDPAFGPEVNRLLSPSTFRTSYDTSEKDVFTRMHYLFGAVSPLVDKPNHRRYNDVIPLQPVRLRERLEYEMSGLR